MPEVKPRDFSLFRIEDSFRRLDDAYAVLEEPAPERPKGLPDDLWELTLTTYAESCERAERVIAELLDELCPMSKYKTAKSEVAVIEEQQNALPDEGFIESTVIIDGEEQPVLTPTPEREALQRQKDELLDNVARIEQELTRRFNAKAEGWGLVILKRQSSLAEVVKELARLQPRKKSIDNTLERMKGTLLGIMDYLGIPSVPGDLCTITGCNNGGKHSVKHDGVAPIPVALMGSVEVHPEDLVRAIREMVKTGESLSKTSDYTILARCGVNMEKIEFSASRVHSHIEEKGEIPPGFSLYRGRHLRVK